MSEEQTRILTMLQEGKISAEEAMGLLQALGTRRAPRRGGRGPRRAARRRAGEPLERRERRAGR